MHPRHLLSPFLLATLIAACQSAPQTPPAAAAPLLAPTGAATAPSAPPPATAPRLSPAVEAQRLLDEPARRVVRFSNGLTLILYQNKTAPVVATKLFIKAGSMTEGPHTGAGLSHLVEHLVAGANSANRHQEEATKLLLQLGNDSNAFTDADQTCYFITTTSDKFPIAAQLLIDLAANSAFTREQFTRECQVVQRELEMDEAQSDFVFFAQVQANRYLQSPARFPVVGSKAALQTLTFEDCQTYYRQMYVPDNMLISIAGDIDLDATQTYILNQIKDIPRRPAPAVGAIPEPAVTAPRTAVAHGDVTQARLNLAFPTGDILNADAPAIDLLAAVLGSGDSSLLSRKLLAELSLVSDIKAIDTTPRYAPGQLEISAKLAPDKIPAARDAVLAVIDDLLKNGITDQALTRARAQVASNFAFDFQSPDQQAVRNAQDFLVAGNIDFTAQYLKRVQAVTREEVQAAARKYLLRDHLLTTVLLPNNAKNPLTQPSADAPPAPEKVLVRRKVLPNGVTLLISHNPAAPVACFNLYTLGGLLAEDNSTSGTGTVMMNLMARQTTTRTHQQVADFLDATGTSVSGTSGSNAFQLSMACLKDHAAESFALFAEMALHPSFTADELEKVRHNLIAPAEAATEEWASEAYLLLRDAYYASSPYKRTPDGRAAVTDKLTPSQLAAHYNTYFRNPAHLVIAIAGDIDPDAAEQWAAPFADLPRQNPTLNLYSITNEPDVLVRTTQADSATIMLAYPGCLSTSPDRDALLLLKTYLGGYNAPSGSLLHETLRSRGLVYTVKAKSIPGPAGGMFLITALGQPQYAKNIADTIQSIVEDLKKGNLPEAGFRIALDQTIAGKKLDQPTVADISTHQAINELLGLGYDDDAKFEGRAAKLTRQDVIRTANKYLTTPTVVVMTPRQ